MKLEVGMYIRSIDGLIRKITKISEQTNNAIVEHAMQNEIFTTDKEKYLDKDIIVKPNLIVKASYNIIDLIEEHDYIRIITSAYFEPVYYSYGKLVIRDDIDISKYTNKFIAEVITHEQMKSMSYKVVEE